MYRQNSTMSQVWVPDADTGDDQLLSIAEETPGDNGDNNNVIKPAPLPDLLNRYRIQTSLDDMKSFMFWKALFAEFLGTFLLVLISVGSTVQSWQTDALDVVQVALAFGLCVATVIWIIGHISGGHINPAVTFAMLVTRRISLIRALLYVLLQCLGAIAGAGLLKRLTPHVRHDGLGTTTVSTGVSPGMAFMVELFITMLLVLTVFATCDNKRSDHTGSNSLAIGLSVTVGHLWAVEYCGSSMNPARSLGPAVVMNIWTDHWVYWLGPVLGGVCAALLYDNVLASNASIAKIRDLLMTQAFDGDEYPKRKVKKLLIDPEANQEENLACNLNETGL